MALPATTYMNGLSALAVMAFGYSTGVVFLAKYFREGRKKRLRPYVALTGFTGGSFYLGPVASFFHVLATGENLDFITYGFLSYAHVPLAIVNAMYLGFELFHPAVRNRVVALFAASAIPYWIALLGFPEAMVAPEDVRPGELVDVQLQSVVLVLVTFYVLSTLFVLGGGFNHLRKRLPEGVERKKAGHLALGWVLFAAGAILDTVIATQFVVVARVVMAAGFYNISAGFW
ncbi:MAG: hypothetical protein Kow0069_20130 [Promethearchaeota archaeon]